MLAVGRRRCRRHVIQAESTLDVGQRREVDEHVLPVSSLRYRLVVGNDEITNHPHLGCRRESDGVTKRADLPCPLVVDRLAEVVRRLSKEVRELHKAGLGVDVVAVESQHSDVTRRRNLDTAAFSVHDDDGMDARYLASGCLVGSPVLEEAFEPLRLAVGEESWVVHIALVLCQRCALPRIVPCQPLSSTRYIP